MDFTDSSHRSMLFRIVLQEMEMVQVRSLLAGDSGCEALPPEEELPVVEPPEELLPPEEPALEELPVEESLLEEPLLEEPLLEEPPLEEPSLEELPLEEVPVEDPLTEVVLLSSCWVSSFVLFSLPETFIPVYSVFASSCLFAACF